MKVLVELALFDAGFGPRRTRPVSGPLSTDGRRGALERPASERLIWFILWLLVITISNLLGSSTQVCAWEEDVHLGLTKWLALNAGFKPGDADTVSEFDQSLDTGHFTNPPWAVMLHVVLDGDPEASRQLQKWHFPSYGRVPGTPEERKVTHDSTAATIGVEDALKVHPGEPIAAALENLGEQLHPFQDSWSHEGVPDIPFRPAWPMFPELNWAHPQTRGGWYSHAADLTYLHVDQTLEMAGRTYELLCQFLTLNRLTPIARQPTWEQLTNVVRQFAKAKTRRAKKQWFLEHGFDVNHAQQIVNDLSLPSRDFPPQN